MSNEHRLLIHIDGQPLQVEKGLTILQAARQNGIEIPTLCDFPGLPSHGSCRMCVVEIQGRGNCPTACTTPVDAGMVISTHSPKVIALRKELLQMLLAEHPAGCLFCPENGHCAECMVTLRKAGVTTGCGSCPKDQQCELQALAEKYEVRQPFYPVRYRALPVEKHDPFFDRDPNLCILCGRCIRACEELHFAGVLTYSSRGAQAVVSTAFQRPHLEANCMFCGSCVEVCPTGALVEKTRKWEGTPERQTASTCPFCALGCQVNLLSRQQRVTGSLPNHPGGSDALCVKGRFAVTELVQPVTRLKQPHSSRAGQTAGPAWQPVSWEEAERSTVEALSTCRPGRFALRISAGATLEDLYVARQFARQVMHSDVQLAEQPRYGSALPGLAGLLQAPASLENLKGAETVVCLGLEDAYVTSVIEVQLKRAHRQGAKIILIGSSQPAWANYADEWIACEVGQEAGALHNLFAWRLKPRQGQQNPAFAGLGEEGPQTPAIPPLPLDACNNQVGEEAPSPSASRGRGQGWGLILGPTALSNPALLRAAAELRDQLGLQVVTLPGEANLVGALRLGLAAPVAAEAPDVLYLIGAQPPAGLPEQVFVIAHTLIPPDCDSPVNGVQGLLLPSTAFSEERGTFIDYAGRARAIHPAVDAPGDARPAWMILAAIARQMDAAGFDYTCVEDIWQAAQAEFPGFPALGPSDRPATETTAGSHAPETTGEPVYLGISLAQRVPGLRSLYPTPNGRGR